MGKIVVMGQNDIPLEDMAREAGLVDFTTELPSSWIDSQYAITGRYPFGFVWCRDKSPIVGEPVPLTDYAKEYARESGILPR